MEDNKLQNQDNNKNNIPISELVGDLISNLDKSEKLLEERRGEWLSIQGEKKTIVGADRGQIEGNIEDKFKSEAYKDFIKKEFPEPKWLIDKIVPAGFLTYLAGAPSSTKTYNAMKMAVCIATGEDYLGMKTLKSKVLFINEEDGENQINRRFKRLTEEIDLSIEVINNNNIIISEDSSNILLDKCLNENIDVVIIDSMTKVLGNLDENSSKDMAILYNLFKKLFLKGIAVILIHHHKKTPDNSKAGYINPLEKARGSSEIGANAHSYLMFEVIPTEKSSFFLHHIKAKNSERIDKIRIRIDFSENKTIFIKENLIVNEIKKIDKVKNDVLNYIKNHNGCSSLEIKEGLFNEYNRIYIKEALDKLEEEKEIVSKTTGGGRGSGKKLLYFSVNNDENFDEKSDIDNQIKSIF